MSLNEDGCLESWWTVGEGLLSLFPLMEGRTGGVWLVGSSGKEEDLKGIR